MLQKFKRKIVLVILLLPLNGCSTILSAIQPTPPPNYLNKIPELPELTRGAGSSPNISGNSSDIREEDFILFCAKTVRDYNLARAQCNALIKWAEDEH